MPMGFRIGDVNNLQEFGRWREELLDPDPERMEIVPGQDPETLTFHPPVYHPGVLRLFDAFEERARALRSKLGTGFPRQWYEAPAFRFGNSGAIVAHGADIQIPDGGGQLDFELQLAAVIGRPTRDVDADDAEDHIAGFSILNDWSLRDLQAREAAIGLGPAKSKDFATSLGPWLVTPDELADRRDGNGYDLQMAVRVNGEEFSRGNWNEIHFSFGEMIARASAGAELQPGDIVTSGAALPSILDIAPERSGGWLKPGDEVELEVERLGVLRNRIG